MKRFRFLVPVGIAAASLIAGNATAEVKNQPLPSVESRSAYQQNPPERRLIMKVNEQGALHAVYCAQH